MRNIFAALASHNVLANVVLVALVTVGIFATMNLVREDLPPLDLRMVQVYIGLPGAGPEEVEEGISRRVEAALDGIEGIKNYHTESEEDGASAVIELVENCDVGDVKDRIEEAINGISTLPEGARRPRITMVQEEEEVLQLVLWGALPERQLKELAESIREDLQRLPEVSLVSVWDTRRYEINIEVSRTRLLEHGLSLANLRHIIQRSSRSQSTGLIRSKGEEMRIRTIGRKDNGRDFASVVVKASPEGGVVHLGEIADVRDGFTDYPAYTSFNGHPGVMIELVKAPGDDSLAISDAVRKYAKEKENTLPKGVNLSPCFDDSEFLRGQISLLVRNGLMGLGLVLVILWLFLNTRLSFWVAMGIPISVGGALIVLWVLDDTLNQVSLMAFIIVLGIIVDDAIVVGEAIYYHRRLGKGPLDAAIEGVHEVGLPVVAAVLTTIVAFLPLGFVPGFIGQIMTVVPTVVIAALAVSLVESLFLLPAHLNHLPDPNAEEKASSRHAQRWQRWRFAPNRALERFSEKVYLPLARIVVRRRYAALCVALGALMITLGAVGGGWVRVVFWPPIDGNYLAAYVEFPVGSPPEVTRNALAETHAAIERVAAETETASGKPLLRNVYTRVFQGAPHMGRIFLEMINPSERGVHSQDISAAWEEEVGTIPGAIRQSFYKESLNIGGAPIEVWLQGKDMNDLRDAAQELKAKLLNYDGVYQVRDDFRPGKTELQVRLKPEAHALGLTLDDVAAHLRGGYYGEEALRFQRGRDDVRVRLRYPEGERQTRADLEKDRIRTARGLEVPLLSVADVTLGQGYRSIEGTNGLRRTVVWAYVDTEKVAPHEVLADLEKNYLDNLAAGYAGMSCSVRGAAESNEQTLAGLQRGFAIAILGVFVIMATVFRSYLQPFVIILVIPFGMVGAVFGHWLMGIPVTFLSMFGIVALTGIVVNDAIVLIECINRLLAEGLPFHEAICRGGVRRFRAIFLTTASTCFGVLPLILETDLQAQMAIPMAVSIAFGLLFATTITLLLVPAKLAILNDIRRTAHWLATRTWPTPESVEPGTSRQLPEVTKSTPAASQ